MIFHDIFIIDSYPNSLFTLIYDDISIYIYIYPLFPIISVVFSRKYRHRKAPNFLVVKGVGPHATWTTTTPTSGAGVVSGERRGGWKWRVK